MKDNSTGAFATRKTREGTRIRVNARNEKEKKNQLPNEVEKEAEAQMQRVPAHGGIYSRRAEDPRVDRRKNRQKEKGGHVRERLTRGWVARGG